MGAGVGVFEIKRGYVALPKESPLVKEIAATKMKLMTIMVYFIIFHVYCSIC